MVMKYRVLQKKLYNLHIYVYVSCKALFEASCIYRTTVNSTPIISAILDDSKYGSYICIGTSNRTNISSDFMFLYRLLWYNDVL
jgi:hypothetical protein